MELLWVLVVTIVFTSQAFRSNVGLSRWQSHRELSRRYENFPTSRTPSTSSSNNQPRSKFISGPRVNQPNRERIKRTRAQEDEDDDDDEDSVKEPNAHLDARQNSWKILAKKLETSKNTTTIFGKQVTNNPNNQKNPTTTDLLQCPHFNECAGCTQTSDFTNTPIMQRAKKFMQSQNIPFQIQVGGYLQWRTLVKLAVQPMSKWGGLRFGLYKAGSHDVLSIPQCKVHHPKINEASEFVRLAALDAGVSGFTPATAKQDTSGDLRYLQLSVSRHTGKVQLVLVWNAENYKSCSASLQRFVKRLKSRDDLFHSIHINFHVGRNNNIFDYEEKNWKLLWGPQVMKEKIGKGTFSFLPQIFKQANIDFFESAIIPYVSRFVPQDSKVAELYAGIGIIGLNIADRAKEVLLSDSNPFVEQVFDECVETFDQAVQEKVFYDCFDADSAIEKGQCDDADVIIVDPPRKGLNEGVLKFFTGKDAEKKLGKQRRLIYVGCGYEAVERDTKDLIASGNWVIKATEGFALFPGSDHIETVIVFDRKK